MEHLGVPAIRTAPPVRCRHGGPRGCPLFSGHRAGAPLQSGCLPPPPGGAVIPAVSEAVALWERFCVPSRGLQGCSHHALPPLLIHQSRRTEPARRGPSFQICEPADSTHLPLPSPSNLTDGPVGSVASKAPSRVPSSGDVLPTLPWLAASPGPSPECYFSSPTPWQCRIPRGSGSSLPPRPFSSFLFKTAV